MIFIFILELKYFRCRFDLLARSSFFFLCRFNVGARRRLWKISVGLFSASSLLVSGRWIREDFRFDCVGTLNTFFPNSSLFSFTGSILVRNSGRETCALGIFVNLMNTRSVYSIVSFEFEWLKQHSNDGRILRTQRSVVGMEHSTCCERKKTKKRHRVIGKTQTSRTSLARRVHYEKRCNRSITITFCSQTSNVLRALNARAIILREHHQLLPNSKCETSRVIS